MKILLDTHVLLWTITNDSKLPPLARKLIGDLSNEIYYSVLSSWEVEIKHEKHPTQMPVDGQKLALYAERSGFRRIGIGVGEVAHLRMLSRKTGAPDHQDPFDGMMICQAAVNGMIFLTSDSRIAEYTDACILYVD